MESVETVETRTGKGMLSDIFLFSERFLHPSQYYIDKSARMKAEQAAKVLKAPKAA